MFIFGQRIYGEEVKYSTKPFIIQGVEKMNWHTLLFFLVLVSTLVCAEGQPASLNNNTSGQYQAVHAEDSGFRPEVNGFSFENYGNDIPTVGLTPAELQRMFGDNVIASRADGKIILTPPANRWMIEANNAMANGHCEGMAVLSELIYYNRVDPLMLGGKKAMELSIEDKMLQKEIAYWWTTQVTSPGGSKNVHDSPNAVFDTLMSQFKDGPKAAEWWVLCLSKPDGTDGHTITPIAVEDFGNGTAKIKVYDNNFPNEIRAIEIDRSNNTWKYYASVNPNEPSALYTGNASTENLEVVSISPRLGKQRCDFCDNSLDGTYALSGEGYIQVWQDGKANLLITDKLGRRIGYLEPDKFINEIPNAEVKRFKFGAVRKSAPLYILPAGGNFTVEINGRGLTEDGFLGVMMIGPGSEMGVQRTLLGPGDRDYMDVIKVGGQYQLRYRSNRAKAIDLIVGMASDKGNYEFEVEGAKVEPNGRVGANLDSDKGNFIFDTNGNSHPGQFQVTMRRIDPIAGEQVFSNEATVLNPNDAVVMNFANWQGEGSNMPIQIINGNGGTTTRDLTNNQDIGYSPSSSMVSSETSSSDSGNIVVPPSLPSDAQIATTPTAPTVDEGDVMGSPFTRPLIEGQDPITINF